MKQHRQLGVVGVGIMGGGIVRRLMRKGIECVVYDLNSDAVAALVAEGAVGADSIEDLVAKLDGPRAVWVMVKAGDITERVVKDLSELLSRGDTIIDGGNTHYIDDIRRAAALEELGIYYVDVGTSGGQLGLERGFCLMYGGDEKAVKMLNRIFRILAPGVQAAPRTPGRTGRPTPAEMGYLWCGPAGSGHFIKGIHNDIEYGMMAAIAEGLGVIAEAHAGLTRPGTLEHPEHYQYEFAPIMAEIAEVWRRGSIVGSFLLDLTATALFKSPALSEFFGKVSDSGEGRWSAIAAIELGVPTPVLNAALTSRFTSQRMAEFIDAVLNAMRKGFGNHPVKK